MCRSSQTIELRDLAALRTVRRCCHRASTLAGLNFRFSKRFVGAPPADTDDWFDTLLPGDTGLLWTPFRVYVEDEGFWNGAHDDLVDFFNLVLELMATAALNATSQHWRAASELLMFPEPVEFCLGYAEVMPKSPRAVAVQLGDVGRS